MTEGLHATTQPSRCRQVSPTILAGVGRCEELLAGGSFRHGPKSKYIFLISGHSVGKTQTWGCGAH